MPRLAVFPKGFFDSLVSGDMALEKWIELAGTLGVDGVEMYTHFFQSLDGDYVRKIGKLIEEQGLEMPMLCHSPDFTQPDIQARRDEIEHTKTVIQLTASLGGRYCRVLSGQNRPGLDRDLSIGWVVDSIEQLIPTAESTGVTLTIENHYKDGTWLYPEFAMPKDIFLAIVEKIQSPWLKVQYDPSNAVVAGYDPYELLDEVAPRVATMHASDRYLEGGTIEQLRDIEADPQHGYATLLKHGVIGEGFNDFDRIFKTLKAVGFKGWISIEDGDGDTIEEGMENLRKSVKFLKEKMQQHF